MKLTINPSVAASIVLRNIARAAGVADVNESNAAAAPSLETERGTLHGFLAIVRYLARNSAGTVDAALLGATQNDEAKVVEWLLFSLTELHAAAGVLERDLRPVVFAVNSHLASRIVLVGSAVSAADLFVLAAVRPLLSRSADADARAMCNVLRWAAFVQRHPLAAGVELVDPAPFETAFAPDEATLAAVAEWQAARTGGAGAAAAAAAASSSAAAPAAAGAAAGGKQGKAGKAAKVPQEGAGASADAGKGGKKGVPAAAAAAASAAAAAPASAAAAPAAAAAADAPKKREKAPKAEKPKAEKAPVEAPKEDFSAMDIRVGVILSARRHPDAEKLYVEEIDLGEEKPRQIVSGLVQFVPMERMIGARVCVLANLRPAKMRGVESAGMVLCASNEDHTVVDFVVPPEGAKPGERVACPGFEGAPHKVLSSKLLPTLLTSLKTDGECVATYAGVPWATSAGPCRSTLPSASIA